ncbi:sensor histidine kinase [Streptomyces triticirhizae]|uniref:histidine kinase n=1 Tax=Streptomyces triticirhizae TaxID=2483353 RepID=A0A3M2LLH7_9ACTN|nr:histidine kinase [Streptomyces triticirhizae]RMI38289.1 sensor histidine kinase [Streptomyces triticirhizae]
MRWTNLGREALYTLVGLVSAIATLLVFPLLAVGFLSTVVGGLGLWLLPWLVLGLVRWAEAHRRRAAAVLGEPDVPRRATLPSGVGARWRWLASDPEVRRALRWAPRFLGGALPLGLFGLLCVGGLLGTVVVVALWPLLPEGEAGLLALPVESWGAALLQGGAQFALLAALTRWVLPPFTRWQARDSLAALTPTAEERLAERVDELTESRAGVLDAHGAELRRIERDLHDGTQARLVAIALRLGVAREELPADSGTLGRLLAEAHEGAEEAMTELRGVIRSMYPPILADRGLQGALTSVAAGAAVRTELELGELGRLPAAVEAAAYFVVTESLTNVAKHSGSDRARVRLTRNGDRLLTEIADGGVGGVDESRGSGVVGIRRRVAALDGTVTVDSPVGGPTVVRAELPCGS